MSQKQRLVVGAWAAVGGLAGFYAYRRQLDFEERTPCVRDAVAALAASPAARAALGSGELQIAPFFRHGSLDKLRGTVRANFEVSGPGGSARVLLTARRRQSATEALEDREEDEELERVGGWRYYLSKPWEIKRAIVDRFRSLRPAPQPSSSSEELGWDIEALLLLPGGDAASPLAILGDPRAVPDYEVECVRRDGLAKDAASRQRLRNVLALVTGAAFVAGGFRLAKSARLSRTQGFVRRTILSNKEVLEAVGPNPTVRSLSGTFTPSYINATLRLVGQNGSAADVQMTAIRDGGVRNPWRIPLARMKLGGLSYNLNLSSA